MYPFIETIRIESGVPQQLCYHNARFNATRRAFWNEQEPLDLSEYVRPPADSGMMRCRVIYGREIEEVSYLPYTIRQVNTLKVVRSDSIDYTYKSTDRRLIDSLFARRGDADDILIIRNNLLTDTSIANVALYNGREWHTPAQPLLKGTRRASLLDKGVVREYEISGESLFNYFSISLFNAMIDFHALVIPINRFSILP